MADLEDIWSFGNVDAGKVEDASIHYVTKYCINLPEYKDYIVQRPFSEMSRRPGIGANYIEETQTFYNQNYDQAFMPIGKYKQRFPRFYKERLFTTLQREAQREEATTAVKERFEKVFAERERRGYNAYDYQRQVDLARIEKLKKNSKSKDT